MNISLDPMLYRSSALSSTSAPIPGPSSDPKRTFTLVADGYCSASEHFLDPSEKQRVSRERKASLVPRSALSSLEIKGDEQRRLLACLLICLYCLLLRLL